MTVIDRVVFTSVNRVEDGVFTNQYVDSIAICGKRGSVGFRLPLDLADLREDTRINLEQLMIDLRIEVEKEWTRSV